MSRAQSYSSDVRRSTGGVAKDVETWLANSLATILAGIEASAGLLHRQLSAGQPQPGQTRPVPVE